MKIRALTMEAYQSCMDNLYQKRSMFTECLPKREWARIGAFSDGTGTGAIPAHHRLSPPPEALLQLAAFNQRIHDAKKKNNNTFPWSGP
jgi:hypothetical protein